MAQKHNFTFQILESGTNKPVQYATITLNFSNNSTKIITDYTNSQGLSKSFTSNDTCFLKISHINYDSLDTIFFSEASATKPYTLFMYPKTNTVPEVVVVTRKNGLIDLTGGYEVNIDKTRANLNINSSEILRRLPGIMQDNSGNLKLMGQNIMIWVDGRRIYLQGNELSIFLKSISSKDIKSIRVYTTPPSVYDASNANVVEIITDNNIKEGLEVRIDGNVGTRDKYYGGFSLNYSNKSYTGNLRGSFNHSNFRTNEGQDQFNYTLPDSTYYYQNISKLPEYITNSINVSTNHDYSLNTKNIIGLTARWNYFENPYSTISSDLNVYHKNSTLTRRDLFVRNNKNLNNFFFVGTNYRRTVNKKGATILIDASSYFRINNRSFNQSVEVYDKNNVFNHYNDIRRNNTTNNSIVKLASATFNYPINSKIALQTGIKLTNVANTENLNDHISTDKINYFIDQQNTYLLDYKEIISALFASASGSIKGVSYQAGLRLEHTLTTIRTEQLIDLTTNKRDHLDLFPSFSLAYSINPTLNVGLGVRRSIIRISYNQLNPLNLRRSSFMSYTGNPYLLPIFQDAIDISLTKKVKEHSVRVMGKFSESKNPFLPIIIQDTIVGQFIERYTTYKSNTSVYLNTSYNGKLKKWLECNVATYGFNTWMNLNGLNNLPNPKAILTVGFTFDFIFHLWKNTSMQIVNQYQGKQVYAQGNGGKFYYTDLTINCNFFKNALSTTLTINDILNTNKTINYSRSPYFESISFIKNETRVGTISISYKLGKRRINKIKSYQNQDDQRFK